MSSASSIPVALNLPAPEVDALIQGQLIVAIAKSFITSGRTFAIAPSDSTLPISVDEFYRPNYLSMAKAAVEAQRSQPLTIRAWASCESCQILDASVPLDRLAPLTIWTAQGLSRLLEQKGRLFLMYLRVYRLPQAISLTSEINTKRQFFHLPNAASTQSCVPVLDERVFIQRRQQLQNLEPPLHPELEELELAIARLSSTSSDAMQFQHSIRAFLNGDNYKTPVANESALAWVDSISTLGDRTIEEEGEEKSRYQAGTDFENIVRRSLEFLGFSIDENYKGGAGGLDLFCSHPYPLAGECKAGRSIPSRTVEELDRIARRHLKEDFEKAYKLIIGPGNPTPHLRESAIYSKVSIIKAMTLQKLVELNAKYPGSVDLYKLKDFLEPGQIDYKIQIYIDGILSGLKLRSLVVQAVSEVMNINDGKPVSVVEVQTCYNLRLKAESGTVNNKSMRDLLVELSSPLTGYLGRIPGSTPENDRFYFLRSLEVS